MKKTPTLNPSFRRPPHFAALRRFTLALVCCCCLASASVFGQCTIGYSSLNAFVALSVDVNGQATITQTTVSPYLTSNCSTAPFNIDLFTDPQLTNPYNTSQVYTCGDIGTMVMFWAQIGDDSGGLPFTVQIIDAVVPTITCPADMTVAVDAGFCTATINNIAVAVDDNCLGNGLITGFRINGGAMVQSFDPNAPVDPSGTSFAIGTNVIEYTATDASGNPNSCTFNVTVTSPNAPTPIANQTESVAAGTCGFVLSSAYVNALDPTTGATCFSNFTITNPAVGSTLSLGVNTISYTYTVNPGGLNPTTTSSTFTITVTDGQAPMLSFPDQSVVATGCTATYTFDGNPVGNPTQYISDNCPTNTAATALDVSYTITGPNNYSFAGTGYDISLVLPVGDDYIVTYTAEDAAGNSASASFDLDVVENMAPVANCQPVTAGLDANGMVTVTAMQFEDGSTDNCTVDFLQFGIDRNNDGVADNVQGNSLPDYLTSFTFDCGDLGATTILYRVTDNSGNVSALCTTTLTVEDLVLPIAQCQAITRNLVNGVSVTVDASELDNGSNDNCNPITNYEISVDTDGNGSVDSPFAASYDFTCAAGPGTYAVELRVTDGSSATSRCPTTVTIVDATDPIAMAMDYSATFNASGAVIVNATNFDNGSSDECSMPSLTYAFGTGIAPPGFRNGTVQPTTGYAAARSLACSAAGMHNVFVKATDGSGNMDIVGPVTLTLTDVTAPTAACVASPFDYTYDALGMTTITAASLNTGSSDNCGLTSVLVYDPVTQTAADAAASITFGCNNATPPASLRLRVTDAAGLSDECDVMLNAVDIIPPTPVCVSTSSVGLTTTGGAFLNVAQIDNGSFDVCGTVVSTMISRDPADPMSYGQQVNFTCADLGQTVPVTLRVEDAVGQENFCTVNVIVQDNLPPVIATTAANVTIECSDYSNTMTYGASPTATDNCGTPALTFSDAALVGTTCSGTVLRTFTFTDAAGNTTNTTQTISLEDTTRPTFTTPADVASACVADVNDTAITGSAGNAQDNCDVVLSAITAQDYTAYRDFDITATTNSVSYDFRPANATISGGITSNPNSSGTNTTNSPTSIALQSGTSGTVSYGYTAPTGGFFVFDYSRSNTGSAGSNNFSYRINGFATDLDLNSTVNSGRVVVPVSNGQFFDFYQQSNGSGRATTVISNFAFVPSAGGVVGLNCDDNLDVVRIFSLTDDCVNTAYDAQYITIRDAAAPSLNYTLSGIIPTDNNACGAQLDLDFAQAGRVSNGGCGQGFTIAYTVTPAINQGNGTDDASGFYGPGTYTVDVELTDDCFGSNTTTFTFTVEDQQAPEAQCIGNFNVTLDNNNQATVTVSDIDNGSSDNCAIDYAASSVSPNTFDQSNVGQSIPVTLTIVDINGNSNTCVTQVEVNGVTMFAAGAVSGSTGDIVNVPVTVSNFTDIAGYQLDLTLADPSIATIIGVSDLNPALSTGNAQTTAVINSGTLSASYINGGTGSTALSLTNGSLLFNLRVQIMPSPAAMTGDVTAVLLSNDQTSFYPSGSTLPTQGSSATTDGSVTVGAPGVQQSVSGMITAASTGGPVEDVTVNLGGTAVSNTQTDAAGSYSFTVPTGVDATLTAEKNSIWNQGGFIDVDDVLAIQTNLSPNVNLSNWQQVAADVDGDGDIDIQDAVYGVLIAFGNELPTVTSSWKFAAGTLSADPLATGFDTQLDFTNVQQAVVNADFQAIKTADVAAPYADANNLTGGTSTEDRNEGYLTFRYDEHTMSYDEVYQVVLRAEDFNGVRGFQHTIAFDQSLVSLENIAPAAALPGFSLAGSFDQQGIAEGQVSVLWFDTDGITLDDNTEVLTLTFRALHDNVAIEDVLSADNSRIKDLSVFSNEDRKGVQYQSSSLTGTGNAPVAGLELRDARPNPFTDAAIIGFELPQALQTRISVSDATGRVVYTTAARYGAGYHEVQITATDLPAAGVYYYQLQTELGTVINKMIRL